MKNDTHLHHRHHHPLDDHRNDNELPSHRSPQLITVDERMRLLPEVPPDSSNGKIKKRRHMIPPPSQWLAYLALLAFLHTIWITRHEDMNIPNRNLPVVMTHSLIRSSRQHRITTSMMTPRRQRVRPTTTGTTSLSSAISAEINPSSHSKLLYPSFAVTELARVDEICGKNQTLGLANERILISGILLHPVATELAIFLARHCGIGNIIGLTEHLLKVEQSQRLEFLMQQVPSLKVKISQYPLTDSKLQKVMESFRPTTIIYFEPLSFMQNPDIVAMRSSMDQLERMCKSMIRQREKRRTPPRLLYVAPSQFGPKRPPIEDTTSIHTTILHTYQSHFQIDAIILNLPTIYGPFVEAQKLLEMTEKASSINPSSRHCLIHITDAIHTVVSALPNDANQSLVVLASPSVLSTTVENINKQIQSIQSSGDSMSDDSNVYPILSWNQRREKPYQNHSLVINDNRTMDRSSVSMLERRQQDLFPCVSECAQGVSCLASVWDSAIPISKSVTNGCRYLLYTANFSTSLTEIAEIKESERAIAWPSQLFCQIAFVSSKSGLVQNALELRGSTISDNLNGNVTSKGWRLIWVEEDDVTLSEADYIMPKIDPASFVSENVTKAFYIEPQHLISLPPLQVIWYLMAKQLDFKGKPAKTVYSMGRYVWRLAVAHKHIALFGHTFQGDTALHAPREEVQSTYMTDLANFILLQKSKRISKDNSVSSRQLETYSKSYRWRYDEHSDFVLVDTFLLVHNLGLTRSKRLRCDWYEEHLFWGKDKANRDLEDLSLSWVLHRWRRHGWLGSSVTESSREQHDEQNSDEEQEEEKEEEDDNSEFGERIFIEEPTRQEESSDDEPSRHYFVKLHNAMEARRWYQ